VFKIPTENRRRNTSKSVALYRARSRIQKLLIMNTARGIISAFRPGAVTMTDTAKRAAIYLRVSTREQSTAMQRSALEEVAARSGWQIVAIYEDSGISGAKGRDQRPEFDRLLKDATRRRFDVVMVWAIDRLGRSLQHLIACLGDLHAAHIDLYLHQQAIDTTTDTGKLFFQMLGAFAEFERSLIRSRVQAGIDRAKATGKRLGRPTIDPKLAAAVRSSLAAGLSIRKAAMACRVSISTVQRLKAAADDAALNLLSAELAELRRAG
jgi:DNA invertase Pin-like site-specific DNA recombinase